jgi:hypothetical protein
MHRLEKIVFEEEGNPDPNDPFDSYAVGGEVVEILKDQRRFKIPMSMADGFTPEMRDAVEQQLRPRDSKAFPRIAGRMHITDQFGSTAGLHKPGWRCASGGTLGDGWLRDGLHDEAQLAYADYEDRLTNAWRGRDADNGEGGHYDETSARRTVIRKALLQRSHAPDDVEDYVEDLDDDDLYGDLDSHVAAFEADNSGRQTDAATLARDHKAKMDELYRQRDAELSNQWRGRRR